MKEQVVKWYGGLILMALLMLLTISQARPAGSDFKTQIRSIWESYRQPPSYQSQQYRAPARNPYKTANQGYYNHNRQEERNRRRQNRDCPEKCRYDFYPVCANNRVTYVNTCEMKRLACSLKVRLQVQYYGECSDEE